MIDRIDDDALLSRFYQILERASLVKEGNLWDGLTKEEQEELLRIDEETDNDHKLIPLSAIKAKHKKWLK